MVSDGGPGLINRFQTKQQTEISELVVTDFGAIFCLLSSSFKIWIHEAQEETRDTGIGNVAYNTRTR